MTKPAQDSISATELVRNLSVAIDTVRITGQRLRITKGSQTVAELCPPTKPGLPITKLAGVLNALPKLGDDAAAMAKDVENLRVKARLPDNPWG
jgi:antitoxin (DNA-binding transcriptional repressor) of toxin-antitoxin stability system